MGEQTVTTQCNHSNSGTWVQTTAYLHRGGLSGRLKWGCKQMHWHRNVFTYIDMLKRQYHYILLREHKKGSGSIYSKTWVTLFHS